MGILIKNGTVVSATESKRMDVLISGEMIARVGAGRLIYPSGTEDGAGGLNCFPSPLLLLHLVQYRHHEKKQIAMAREQKRC